MKKEIIVMIGGRSCEHDISVITGLYAFNALKDKKYNKTLVYLRDGRFYIGKELEKIDFYIALKTKILSEVTFINGKMYEIGKKLKEICRVDCALLCFHGGEGEGGAMQGYLEVNSIPYTSPEVFSSCAFMDKEMTKRLLLFDESFKTVPYVTVKMDDIDPVKKVETAINGYPVIVKPARLGSSIGICKADNELQLKNALEVAFHYDAKALVEKCLENFTELNCAAYRKNGDVITGMIERPYTKGGFLSYDEKYMSGVKEPVLKQLPAKISKQLTEIVKNTTKNLYDAFDMKGVVRVDYLYADNTLYVNEVNTIPGSLAFYLFSRLDIPFNELLTDMIEEAINRAVKARRFSLCFQSEILSKYSGKKDNYIKK